MLLCLLMLCGCADDEAPAGTTTAPAVTTQATTVPATVPDTTAPVQDTTAPVMDTTAPAETTVPSTTVPVETTVPPATTPVTTQAPTASKNPDDDDFVRVVDYIPDVIIDLKYATADNMCGKVVYSFDDAYLRYGTVKKLAEVQKELAAMGYTLKIWDAYRPATAQFDIWNAYPDPTYVTHPQRGYSAHCRGSNVDVTIVDKEGNELVMPTGFDEFNAMADRDYSDCTAEAAKNAQFLEDIMTKHGFKGHILEWWQFTDADDYEIETEFLCE